MYETEINARVEPASQLPDEVRCAFAASRENVVARTLLPWSEHCTECVWPTCYTTCDLYAPREDKQCRRFIDGMVRIDAPETLNGYVLKIRFKRWGKLWAPGTLRLFSKERAIAVSARDNRIGSALRSLPVPWSAKRILTLRRYNFKKRVAERARLGTQLPSALLLECYNPGGATVNATLTIRPRGSAGSMPYQRLLRFEPGFLRTRIPLDEILAVADLRQPFTIEVAPNAFEDGMTLYFGVLDFVREAPAVPVRTVKCIVWDLDETLWEGVLTEDGAESLKLKPRIAELLKELDRRGILLSIASKNDARPALAALAAFGVAEYFLHPQISWSPKSEAIEAIARRLNIATSDMLFIDDSEFERQQVLAAFPEVRVWHAARYLELLGSPECAVTPTAEAGKRREMYAVEAKRREAAANHQDDYLAFLKDCAITLRIGALSAQNLERVHELTQRTNQMNFSGNRYDRDRLREILVEADVDTYVLACEDRFGEYGVIGFCTVNSREPRMTDLMFSCRIQAKRVEHAFLNFLTKRYRGANDGDFFADYRRTERNAPSGRVFSELGFVETGSTGGVSHLVLPNGKTCVDDNLITIIDA